jgi:hypothetical protein
MLSCELQRVSDPVRGRLELKHRRKLRLTARPTVIDHHFPRDRLRYIDAEIIFD